MDIDIVLDSHLPQDQLTELGLLAEQYGIRTVWNASYLDGRDPLTNMSELARRSSSIRVAPMALNAYEMHPFRIGMALLTLNEIAGGRVQTMIGGGGEVVMALGIPFEKTSPLRSGMPRDRQGHVHESPVQLRGGVIQYQWLRSAMGHGPATLHLCRRQPSTDAAHGGKVRGWYFHERPVADSGQRRNRCRTWPHGRN